MRNCPRCHTEMRTQTQYDVTLDSCPKCERVFLDCGELMALSRQRPDIEEKLQLRMGKHDTGDQCPECQHMLVETRLEYMMIERCDYCCGVFLAKSTLDNAMNSKPLFSDSSSKTSKGFF